MPATLKRGGRKSGDGEGAASRVQREPATASSSIKSRVAVIAANPAAPGLVIPKGMVTVEYLDAMVKLRDERIRKLAGELKTEFTRRERIRMDNAALKTRVAELEKAIDRLKGNENVDPEKWGINIGLLFKVRDED